MSGMRFSTLPIRKGAVSATTLALVVFFWTAVAALFDADCLFEYLPRLGFGAVAIGTVLVFASWRPKAAAASAIFLGLWLAVLYPIRWNHLKSFYIDSHSLREGMPMDEVRQVMSSYLEVGRNYTPSGNIPPGIFGATMLGVPESKDEHDSRVLFIPSEADCADWCVVYPEGGVVKSVAIHPD
jgi:hypothetical protein